MSRTTRSKPPLRAWSRPACPSATLVVRCPSARRPLDTNDAIRCSSSTIRMRAIWGASVWSSSCWSNDVRSSSSSASATLIGMVSTNTASSTGHADRAVRSRDGTGRSTGRDRNPRRGRGTAARPKRSKICSRSLGATPGPESRTHSRAVPPSYDEPIATVSPSSVCLTALSASWSSAWVRRCSSTGHLDVAVSSRVQSRSPRPRAFATRSVVRPGRSTGRRRRKSGRSLFASSSRSPTRRDIRSTSSRSSSRVSGDLLGANRCRAAPGAPGRR